MTHAWLKGQGAIECCPRSTAGTLRAQGSIESSCGTTARSLHAQGATEYLVLLAVVLIIAVVTIALLGFFPGTAGDAEITESSIYWRAAAPIAIIETAATTSLPDGNGRYTFPYLRVRNNGNYPLRITKVFSGISNGFVDQVAGGSGSVILADYYYLFPGEEKRFISSYHSGCMTKYFYIDSASSISGSWNLGGAQTTCRFTSSDGRDFGNLYIKEFGFEYEEYIEGQTITKRQMGKALVVKCTGPTPLPQPWPPSC